MAPMRPQGTWHPHDPDNSSANVPDFCTSVQDDPLCSPQANDQIDPTILGDDTLNEQEESNVMHEAFSNLMDAEYLLRQKLDVAGIFFIEIMAGECSITLGILMERVPCLKPWDIVFGEPWNVLTRGHILLQLA